MKVDVSTSLELLHWSLACLGFSRIYSVRFGRRVHIKFANFFALLCFFAKSCVLYNIISSVGKSIHSQSFKNITIDGKTNSHHITNKFLCSGKFGANKWKKLAFSFEISHRRMKFCNHCLLYSFKFAFMSCVLIQKYIKARDTGRYYKQKFIGGQRSRWAMHTSGRFLGNVL